MKLPRLRMSSLDAWGLLAEKGSTYALCEGRDKWFRGSSFMLLQEDIRLVVELSEGDVVGLGLSQGSEMGWA